MTDLRTTSLPPTESSLKNGIKYNGNNPARNDHVMISLISVTLLICLLGLVGNGIVLWILGFRIKRNPYTVYVLNLAAADFVFLFCVALSRTNFMWDFLKFYNPLDVFLAFMYNSSLSLLTAISAERCVSVLFPIWYRCHRPKHLSAITCALLWALSCLITGLRAYVCFSVFFDNCKEMLLRLTRINFFIFTPITVLSSLILLIKVQRSSLQSQPRKLYIVILLNVLFFLLFIVPFSIITFFLKGINYDHFINSSFMLASINSTINPVIYFLIGSYRNKKFRRSVKKALQSVFDEETGTREERVSATEIPKATNLEDPIMG